ncbi:unnamed protein product, partial [Adineta steineri]
LIKQIPTKKPRSAYIHYISSLDRAGADLKVSIFIFRFFVNETFIFYRIL